MNARVSVYGALVSCYCKLRRRIFKTRFLNVQFTVFTAALLCDALNLKNNIFVHFVSVVCPNRVFKVIILDDNVP